MRWSLRTAVLLGLGSAALAAAALLYASDGPLTSPQEVAAQIRSLGG